LIFASETVNGDKQMGLLRNQFLATDAPACYGRLQRSPSQASKLEE